VTFVDSTHALVTFTAAVTGGYTYKFGDGGSVAVNVNASSFSVSNITDPKTTPAGSGNEDGFGSFNLKFNTDTAHDYRLLTVTFELTNLSGTWADDKAVLIANSDGHRVAAHVFVYSTDPLNADATGFATDSGKEGGAEVPAPPSVILLGLGVLGVGFGSRWRRRQVLAA